MRFYPFTRGVLFMQSITAISSAAPQHTARGVYAQEALARRDGAKEEQERMAPTHNTDEYVRGETPEPSGRYWPERGAGGKPSVHFDGPARANAAPAAQKERAPSASDRSDEPDQKAEPAKEAEPERTEKRCAVNTDRVDREIEALKKQKAELEKQLRAATGDAQTERLQARLEQIERELAQKDNDAYRRKHAAYTDL